MLESKSFKSRVSTGALAGDDYEGWRVKCRLSTPGDSLNTFTNVSLIIMRFDVKAAEKFLPSSRADQIESMNQLECLAVCNQHKIPFLSRKSDHSPSSSSSSIISAKHHFDSPPGYCYLLG